MIRNTPSLDLMEYVETNILPQYAVFDVAHNTSHVVAVIRRSLALAVQMGADVNMAYAIAAYHDIGMSGPRAIHHITGGRILAHDTRLRHWFSAEQVRIMKEAVEDHRASASHAPRSVYGRIVAEADRDMTPDVVFRRAIQYGLSSYPELDHEHQWLRFKSHIDEKYSTNGYIRLWIPGSENAKKLAMLRSIISDPAQLRVEFERIYAEELKTKSPTS